MDSLLFVNEMLNECEYCYRMLKVLNNLPKKIGGSSFSATSYVIIRVSNLCCFYSLEYVKPKLMKKILPEIPTPVFGSATSLSFSFYMVISSYVTFLFLIVFQFYSSLNL